MKLYEYHVTFEGHTEVVTIDATDAGHAYSEISDDADLWPEGATGDEKVISIIRGAERPYEA